MVYAAEKVCHFVPFCAIREGTGIRGQENSQDNREADKARKRDVLSSSAPLPKLWLRKEAY